MDHVVVPAWLAKPSAKREQITLEPQHSSVSVFILESGEVVARDPEFEWDKQNKLHLGIEALQKEAFDAAKAYQKQLHKTKKLKKSLSVLKGAKAKAAVQLPSHYQEKDKEKVEEEGKPAAEGVAPTMQTMLDSVDMNKGGDTEQTDDTVPATVPANISEVATQEGLKESEAEKSEQTKAESEKTSFQSSMSVSASAAQATDSDDDLEISERLDFIMKEMIDMEKTVPGPPPRFVKMDVTIHSFPGSCARRAYGFWWSTVAWSHSRSACHNGKRTKCAWVMLFFCYGPGLARNKKNIEISDTPPAPNNIQLIAPSNEYVLQSYLI